MPKTEKNAPTGRTGRGRGNPDNIRKLNKRLTQEERTEAARKAGKASGEARRQRKTMKEQLAALLEMPSDIMEGMSNGAGVCAAMLAEAQRGNVSAAVWVRDLAGEKPTDKMSADLTNSDGSLASRGAGLDLSTMTPEQISELCQAAFSNGGE